LPDAEPPAMPMTYASTFLPSGPLLDQLLLAYIQTSRARPTERGRRSLHAFALPLLPVRATAVRPNKTHDLRCRYMDAIYLSHHALRPAHISDTLTTKAPDHDWP
jgi:hypothetical protein